jgi:hypothetical protein
MNASEHPPDEPCNSATLLRNSYIYRFVGFGDCYRRLLRAIMSQITCKMERRRANQSARPGCPELFSRDTTYRTDGVRPDDAYRTGANATVNVEADDGTGPTPKSNSGNIDKNTHVTETAPPNAAKGTNSAFGEAMEWNNAKGNVEVIKAGGAAVAAVAKCTSTVSIDSDIPWKGKKNENFQVDIETTLSASPDATSSATIDITVKLDVPGGNTTTVTYTLSEDKTDNTKVTIKDGKKVNDSVLKDDKKTYTFKGDKFQVPGVEAVTKYAAHLTVVIKGESKGAEKVTVESVVFHIKSV